MEQLMDDSQQSASVCVIQGAPGTQRQLQTLLGHLGAPVLQFNSPDEFLAGCDNLDIGCILIDGDELGESARAFIKELSRLGLAQCSIIMASQANIDDAVSATQSGIADYVEIPQPDRQLLAKIRSVMGSARSTPAADSVN
jgi:FixJ family two-component response regulator